MTTRVGDSIFLATGNPGVITTKDASSGRIGVDEGPEEVAREMRHGYINGLSQEQRDQFNGIMDEVRETPDAKERVAALESKIRELGDKPENRIVSRYLDAQKMHIEHSAGLKPRYYTVDEFKVR